MSQYSTQHRGSEATLRAVLGFVALVVIPPLLALLFFATQFRGLRAEVAVEHSQLARHLVAGEGFVTSVIRPLSLAFNADLLKHPDLYNAPVHPVLLAVCSGGDKLLERLAGVVGASLWLISVWLTYWFARRWFDAAVARLAVALYAVNVTMISLSIGGLPHPLLAIITLLLVGLPNSSIRYRIALS